VEIGNNFFFAVKAITLYEEDKNFGRLHWMYVQSMPLLNSVLFLPRTGEDRKDEILSSFEEKVGFSCWR